MIKEHSGDQRKSELQSFDLSLPLKALQEAVKLKQAIWKREKQYSETILPL